MDVLIAPVVDGLPTSPAASVLLYTVNRITSPLASVICLFANRDGGEEGEILPPHFCVGSPGQVVLHAEAGYWIKSSDASVGREYEEQ